MIFDIIYMMKNETKSFYKSVLSLSVPLSLQQLLGSAMEMIDSLMVSWIGMISAVGSASQIMIIANTITWGILSGTSIFASQFYGKNDEENLKRSFGISLLLTMGNALFWFLLISFFKNEILHFYIQDEIIIEHAKSYLSIARFSLFAEALAFSFSYHFRCINQANLTLKVSILAMIVNITLNYVLIFGIGFIPALNIQGAALATLIAHLFSIIIYFIYGMKTKAVFMGSFHELFSFKQGFVSHVFRRVYPLMMNEALFGFGSSLIIKAIATLGTNSLEAYYIGDQIASFFSFIIWGFGGSVQIMIGHDLGKGSMDEALNKCHRFLKLAAIMAILLGSLLVLASPLILKLYHIQSENIYRAAISLLAVFAFRIAFRFMNFTIFSILRSGGDSRIISFLDAGIMFLVAIPLAFLGASYIQNVALVFLLSQSEQIVRFVLGMKRILSKKWAENLTDISAKSA